MWKNCQSELWSSWFFTLTFGIFSGFSGHRVHMAWNEKVRFVWVILSYKQHSFLYVAYWWGVRFFFIQLLVNILVFFLDQTWRPSFIRLLYRIIIFVLYFKDEFLNLIFVAHRNFWSLYVNCIIWLSTLVKNNSIHNVLGTFFSNDRFRNEIDDRRPREGTRFLLREAARHRSIVPRTRIRGSPSINTNHGYLIRNRGK